MIDIKNMKFGDKVYIVKQINNVFNRNRIEMLDDDGNVWHRYDKPNFEYEIEELEYCGLARCIEQGEVRFDEERLDTYHFRYPDGSIYPEYAEDLFEIDYWVSSEAEAKEYVKNQMIEENT